MSQIKSKGRIKRKRVTFSLNLSDAEKVVLMGDFNDWNPKKHPMKKDDKGMWNKYVLLPPGRYEYKFLVDGQWLEKPQNSQICSNCFGTYNNVLFVSR